MGNVAPFLNPVLPSNRVERIRLAFPGILRSLIRFLQIILHVPTQIVFIPFAVAGLTAGLYKERVNSKRPGASFTTYRGRASET